MQNHALVTTSPNMISEKVFSDLIPFRDEPTFVKEGSDNIDKDPFMP